MNDRVLLVDLENVQRFELSKVPSDTRVKIFVGQTQSKLPTVLVQQAQALGSRLEWVRIDGNGRNALDFHIACHLGEGICKFPKAEFVKHAWAGAWIISIFRNEDAGPLASTMVRDAMAIMQTEYAVPALGCVTFVDPKKVRGVLMRGERVKGFCFMKAGFRAVGETKKGLIAWQMQPSEMPPRADLAKADAP